MVSWELLTIFHQYGQPLWAIGAFLTITAKMYKYRWEVVACPYSHIITFINGYISLKHATARIIAQFVGGMVFYRYLVELND